MKEETIRKKEVKDRFQKDRSDTDRQSVQGKVEEKEKSVIREDLVTDILPKDLGIRRGVKSRKVKERQGDF